MTFKSAGYPSFPFDVQHKSSENEVFLVSPLNQKAEVVFISPDIKKNIYGLIKS